MSDTFDHEADAWDGWEDGGAEDDDRYAPWVKTCRHCYTTGLLWGQHQGRWRLYDGNELHVCPPTEFQPRAPDA